nr:AAA family ATPase [Candidatus Njordarchaeum guaymaensis]
MHGSGKTTVYNSLRALYRRDPRWLFMPERMGRSPYPFGSKDPQVAFRAEIWYLRQMLKRNELIRKRSDSNLVVVCDRSPICVLAYSHALCSLEDYKIIRDLYLDVEWEENAVFYLEMNLESTQTRLMSGRRRNLRKWNEGEEEYILRVLEGYEKVFKDVKQNRTLNLVRIPNGDARPRETIQRVNKEILQRSGENT